MFIQIKTIKAKYIISGLLISMVTLCVVSAASYYVSRSIVSRQLDMRMQATAGKNASELNLWFNDYKKLIDNAVADIEMTPHSEINTVNKYFAEKVRLSQNNIKDIYFATKENFVYTGLRWTPPPGYQVKTRPWFKEAVADGSRTVFTKPYDDLAINSDQTSDLVITISKTVYRNGKQSGVFAADIMLSLIHI